MPENVINVLCNYVICCSGREQANSVTAERSAIEIKLLQDKVGTCDLVDAELAPSLPTSDCQFSPLATTHFLVN